MAKQIGKGKNAKWLDPDGNSIPVKYIDKQAVCRDKLVCKVFGVVEKLSMKIQKEKGTISTLIHEYLDEIATKFNQDWKGNTTLYDFSQTMKIDINISNRLAFTENLQIAKNMIDECVKRWSEESDDKIKVVIDRAFKTDKKGNLDTKMILKLRTIKFDDKDWKEAMELIADSIIIEGSKEYFVFSVKDEKTGIWEKKSLNFSAL